MSPEGDDDYFFLAAFLTGFLATFFAAGFFAAVFFLAAAIVTSWLID